MFIFQSVALKVQQHIHVASAKTYSHIIKNKIFLEIIIRFEKKLTVQSLQDVKILDLC